MEEGKVYIKTIDSFNIVVDFGHHAALNLYKLIIEGPTTSTELLEYLFGISDGSYDINEYMVDIQTDNMPDSISDVVFKLGDLSYDSNFEDVTLKYKSSLSKNSSYGYNQLDIHFPVVNIESWYTELNFMTNTLTTFDSELSIDEFIEMCEEGFYDQYSN